LDKHWLKFAKEKVHHRPYWMLELKSFVWMPVEAEMAFLLQAQVSKYRDTGTTLRDF